MPVTNTGTESNGVSAHGTRVTRNGTDIPELRDVTPPRLSRDTFDTTKLSDVDEEVKTSIRKMGEMTLVINLVFDDPDILALIDAWADNTIDEYAVYFTDGAVWVFDGIVINLAPEEPVDGAQTMRVVVRPTGNLRTSGIILMEDGGAILAEDGTEILV